jgi:predicted kinase
MLIVMAGLPAAGKSTIAEVVGNRMGTPVVSVDPIEAAILSAGIDADQPTGLAAYLVAEAFADSVVSGGGSIIVDAVNAVSPAREQWVKLAERQRSELRFIEVICSDRELHGQRLAARAARLAAASLPESFAVEQSLDEWEEWTGASGAIARITLDSVEPLGVNVERALAFLQR